MPEAPEIRIRAVNRRPVRKNGDYVLFWMIAARPVLGKIRYMSSQNTMRKAGLEKYLERFSG
jgi:hypothetical protein